MKLTLEKYQAIQAISDDKSLSDIDKTLYCICALWDYAPEELDKEDPLKVVKMAAKIEKIFKFKVTAPTIIGIYKIDYNISNITFGQYIDLSFFFSFDAVEKSNYVVATMAKSVIKKSHPQKAGFFLKSHVAMVVGAMDRIRTGFMALNKEFGALFGLDEDLEQSVTENFQKEFNKRYGWIYSAEVVAAYERISIDDCYKLPARQVLNDLVYLKAKQKYEYLLTKR